VQFFGAKAKGVKDNSYRMPDGEYGRVIETVTFNRRTKLTYKFEKIYVFIAQIRKFKLVIKLQVVMVIKELFHVF
jgi:DNA-directed RNA polymerase beta subunit